MRIFILSLFLLSATIVKADVTYTVIVTDEEAKILDWQLVSPQQWVENAVKGKISKSEDRMLEQLSDKRVDKLTEQEKKNLIKNSTLKTRAERDKE